MITIAAGTGLALAMARAIAGAMASALAKLWPGAGKTMAYAYASTYRLTSASRITQVKVQTLGSQRASARRLTVVGASR